MQDWLAERQLDRKALDALARNAALVHAWQQHTQAQGVGLVALLPPHPTTINLFAVAWA